MSDLSGHKEGRLRPSISASVTSIASVLRGFPLLFAARPRTPLRVLCVMAFDTLYRLRNSMRMPAGKLVMLSSLLDCGGCVNAFYDKKSFCRKEYGTTRRLLQDAGLGELVDEYLGRLEKLEGERPSIGGDYRQHGQVQLYREAVVRLSLGSVAATAFEAASVGEGVRAINRDHDLEILFRIVMQCQIIDDVLDFREDACRGLPSFLTSTISLPEALELTRSAAIKYADSRDLPLFGKVFPLRVALFGASIGAKLVIALGGWGRRTALFRKRGPSAAFG